MSLSYKKKSKSPEKTRKSTFASFQLSLALRRAGPHSVVIIDEFGKGTITVSYWSFWLTKLIFFIRLRYRFRHFTIWKVDCFRHSTIGKVDCVLIFFFSKVECFQTFYNWESRSFSYIFFSKVDYFQTSYNLKSGLFSDILQFVKWSIFRK